MPFLAIGVEHKSAPLDVREGVALEGEPLEAAVRDLAGHDAIEELVILSTCNRTETYLFTEDIARARPAVSERVFSGRRITDYLLQWEELDAVRHLFRVASGLESQVLGEPQVLSQVSEALETSRKLDASGPNLNTLFQTAIRCARRARSATALGKLNPSLGSEAVEAAEEAVGSLEQKVALVIGGGEISRLVAEELRRHKLKKLFISNRTDNVASDLAQRFNATALPLAEVSAVIPEVDLIFTATSARNHVLTAEDFPSPDQPARTKPLHIFDLAIPRDVDPAIGSMPGIALIDLDGLLPSGVLGHWAEDVNRIESVIEGEVNDFSAWYLTRRVVPVIANLRSHVEEVKRRELERIAPQLSGLSAGQRAAVELMTQRLIDKMFHHLVTRLRLAAQTDPKLVDAAEFFFLHGEGGLFAHAVEDEQEAQTEPEPDRKKSRSKPAVSRDTKQELEPRK